MTTKETAPVETVQEAAVQNSPVIDLNSSVQPETELNSNLVDDPTPGNQGIIQAPQASVDNRQVDLRERYLDKSDPQDSPSHQRKINRMVERGKFITIAEEIAKHTFYYRNFKYKGADQLFPHPFDVDQRIVTKCFPLAQKGPLLVSEPTTTLEIKKAYELQKVLRSKGMRHIVIESDTSVYDALEQLGEI